MRRSFKPGWMRAEEYRAFVAVKPPTHCHHCNDHDVEELTVDHIIARSKGGTNEVENLQWLCGRCNSSKNNRPDRYWSSQFPFDIVPDLSKCRGSQREHCWDLTMSYAEFFCRPISSISQVLNIFAFVVGAGKSFVPPIFASAINCVRRIHLGSGCPRIDRILILTPAESIRSGIYEDLRKLCKEVYPGGTRFRINPVRDGSIFDTDSYLDQWDIHVACVQMLFSKNGSPRKNLEQILSKFPLIAFDEPHYAQDQVRHIITHASQSIVAGFTATPIEANGDLMRHMVRFSHYGYQDANRIDGSMKHIDMDSFMEIDPSALHVHHHGEMNTVRGIDRGDHAKQLRAEMEVARAVLERMVESDKIVDNPSLWEPAPHRENKPIGHAFYDHPLIVVGSRHAAVSVTQQINNVLDARPDLYPKSKGYGAEYAIIGDDDLVEGKKLDRNHPWLLAHNADGNKIQPGSKRILVVCSMGREGLNNRCTCTIGLAKNELTVREMVQRLGRAIRACPANGVYPPSILDKVKCISHVAYGNKTAFERGLHYILNSEEYLDDMLTIEDIMEDGLPAEGNPSNPDAIVERGDKIKIARKIGEDLLGGKHPIDIDIPGMVDEFGGESPGRRAAVREWIDTIFENPNEAKKLLLLDIKLREIPRVLDEIIPDNPSDDVLIDYLKREDPDLVPFALRVRSDDVVRAFALSNYRRYRKQFYISQLVRGAEKLSTIRQKIAGKILDATGITGKETGKVYGVVGMAMKIILGADRTNESLIDGGQYDTAICHAILARPRVLSNIFGFAINLLTKSGYCQPLATALNIDPESIAFNFGEDDFNAA